jgi:hypothetical protein
MELGTLQNNTFSKKRMAVSFTPGKSALFFMIPIKTVLFMPVIFGMVTNRIIEKGTT